MKKDIDIIIRKAKPGDEKCMAEVVREGLKRKNWIYTGANEAPNKEKLKKMRKEYGDNGKESFCFLAIDKSKNKIIGSVFGRFKKVGRIRHRINCGWGIHPDYQGKGIATKLLKMLLGSAKKKGLKRAEAEIAVENIASIKLAKKLGFEIEGRKKKAFLTDSGRYIDTYIVGRLLK